MHAQPQVTPCFCLHNIHSQVEIYAQGPAVTLLLDLHAYMHAAASLFLKNANELRYTSMQQSVLYSEHSLAYGLWCYWHIFTKFALSHTPMQELDSSSGPTQDSPRPAHAIFQTYIEQFLTIHLHGASRLMPENLKFQPYFQEPFQSRHTAKWFFSQTLICACRS